ncbi:hypothetical protein CNR34_00132 [Pseudomonas phage nickie]|uniref:Uncharacterized protein n=1 Tax=Pseudomonas phage nickie TaxID=2048977 RepID=A0A2H4P7B9_9CAUD|nr:hypothetical protein FDJ16_gp033 [Pseudomonas phage nickie]ATW58065.1 hypothetical protein CNR34_00132 [Pseudomonas phage nickie]
MTVFTATKPKCVQTNNGVAWATSIKVNGIVVAKISNDGRGACDDHHWLDKSHVDEFVAQTEAYNAGLKENLHAMFDKKDHRGQPGADFCSGFVEHLMQEAEKLALFERDCKKHVVVQLPGKDTLSLVKNTRPTPELVAKLKKQYPGIKILNPGFDK